MKRKIDTEIDDDLFLIDLLLDSNLSLPEIAKEEEFDMLSAKGFAFGYIGSVILLVFNLIIIQNPDWFGMPAGSFAPRFSFIVTGIWWIGFAQIPFRVLPNNPYKKSISADYLLKGYREVNMVFKELRAMPVVNRFLVSFFFLFLGLSKILSSLVSASTSISSVSPSCKSPFKISSAMGSSKCFWMALFNGRAPKLASKPFSAINSLAASVSLIW